MPGRRFATLRVACRCGEKASESSPSDAQTPLVVQENHYDPFGLDLTGLNKVPDLTANRFKYIDRELQEGLGWYDLQARFYDPANGRFLQSDDLSKSGISYGNISSEIEKGIGKILSYTDANDATVLVTTLTRAGNAINLDGSKETTSDKGFALAGAFLPIVGGSTAKKAIEFIGERAFGAYKSLLGKYADAHHIIQDAAVKHIQGYKKLDAPTIHLEGPAVRRSTPHGRTRTIQQDLNAGGGTYGSERRLGYRALRAAGLTIKDAKEAVRKADKYFESLGVTLDTQTLIPKDRK